MRKENLKKQILVHLSLFSHGGGGEESKCCDRYFVGCSLGRHLLHI